MNGDVIYLDEPNFWNLPKFETIIRVESNITNISH